MDADVTGPGATRVASHASVCPACGGPIAEGELFCESCGTEVAALSSADADGTAVDPAHDGSPHDGTLLDDASVAGTDRARHSPFLVADVDLAAVPPECTACGGAVAVDGYCEQCGAAAPRLRDHWVDRPAGWLAAVCDRGVRHSRNEDAVAVAAAPEPSSLGALVVCDGVSMAPGSDVASLAAARAARDALIDGLRLRPSAEAAEAAEPEASGTRSAGMPSRAGEFTTRILAAGAVAQRQAAAAGDGVDAGKSPPSCTFVAGLVERPVGAGPGLVAVGWVGDSRAYWLPDDGQPIQLSEDDSWAAEAIAHGVPRAEAESMPRAHAITRWLGADAPDPVPRTRIHPLDRAGWVLLCSDGLWNYASDAEDLADRVHRILSGRRDRPADDPAAEPAEPADEASGVAEDLVAWAIEQGGHDNITVALARFVPSRADDPEER